MNSTWVVNASPLIVLSKIGQADLLAQLCEHLLVPEAVYSEVTVAAPDAASDWMTEALAASRLSRCNVTPDPIVLAWDLGSGETEVLSLAQADAGRVRHRR